MAQGCRKRGMRLWPIRRERVRGWLRRLIPAVARRKLSPWYRRGRHTVSVWRVLLPATIPPDSWPILLRAWRTERSLPALLDAQTLPEVLQRLDTSSLPPRPDLATAIHVTRLADAVVALVRHAEIGPCLRRSVVRFRLLRQIGLPVIIHVGAQKMAGPERGAASLVGHAWLTLDGFPWEESLEPHQDYVVMYSYPPEA